MNRSPLFLGRLFDNLQPFLKIDLRVRVGDAQRAVIDFLFPQVLHASRADDVIPYADSEELVRKSGLPAMALIEVGTDHRLADPEPLAAMLKACEKPER
jgi:hypothetical protein